jgi:hypothetical protein
LADTKQPIESIMRTTLSILFLFLLLARDGFAQAQPTERQLAQWLKRFPTADANGDGRLTVDEAAAFRKRLQSSREPTGRRRAGAPSQFQVDPGWQADRFPDHAVCYRSPREIAAIYADLLDGSGAPVTSYSKPADGSLRIVGTGHSFMAPGFRTFPLIADAAGLHQPPLFTQFCLKTNPQMKFYLADAWPQLDQLDEIPSTEAALTDELLIRLGREKNAGTAELVGTLNEKYPGKVFVLPTNDAMVLAVQYYHRGELPGVEGIHTFVGGKERSLWRDRLGHLGPGFGNLEGYVFYAAMYGRSPELIQGDIRFPGTADYPSRELDRVFRKIAWQAVANHPLSGVTDRDNDGVHDGSR